MLTKAFTIPKLRLATQLTLFVVFSVLLSVVAAYLVTLRSEQSFEYRKAERRAMTLLPALEEGLDEIKDVAWVLPPRAATKFPPPEDIRNLTIGHHLLDRDEGPLHVVISPIDNQRRAIVLYSSVPHQEQRETLLLLLGGVAMMLVAATVALSPWWAGFLLRHDPMVRKRIGQQMSDAAKEAFRTQDAEATTLAKTYTEYVRLLYDPNERSKEFIANIAHELRTPLTHVRSGCEVLANSPELTERNQKRLLRMISALDHMGETIRSFLLLAREGDYGTPTYVLVEPLLHEIASLYISEAAESGVELTIGPSDEGYIEVQREALWIVVSNLIRNAIRHGTKPGRVEVTYKEGVITVRDDGPGISKEDRLRIFQPFFRAKRSAEQGVFGLGLGLAIVKRVCEACEWEIDVDSNEGEGTCFRVNIGN